MGHDFLKSRGFDLQVAEFQIYAAILNRFTALGTPQTVRMGEVCLEIGELGFQLVCATKPRKPETDLRPTLFIDFVSAQQTG